MGSVEDVAVFFPRIDFVIELLLFPPKVCHLHASPYLFDQCQEVGLHGAVVGIPALLPYCVINGRWRGGGFTQGVSPTAQQLIVPRD
jgi:hypothetical protein